MKHYNLPVLVKLITGFAILFGCGALYAADSSRQPLEFAWFKDDYSRVIAVTKRPIECVKQLDNPKFNLGRLAFNSPRLLGGQAGRMGLNCASCHPAGRSEDQFFVRQISDQPGRADISHHFLSSLGGDNSFNPMPIPDLANVNTLRFKDRTNSDFDDLLKRLIEVEFDGQTTADRVFESLKLYLSQNDIAYCRAPFEKTVRRLESDWGLIEDGLEALKDSIEQGDLETTKFVSSSIRSVLETFYRFYSIKPIASIDKKLLEISRSFQRLPNADDEQRLVDLRKLAGELAGLEDELLRHQENSFYNSDLALKKLKERE